jgi:hypothetical protein
MRERAVPDEVPAEVASGYLRSVSHLAHNCGERAGVGAHATKKLFDHALIAFLPVRVAPRATTAAMGGQDCIRDMCGGASGSGVRGPCIGAMGCVGNGVERAGYNFHCCIKARRGATFGDRICSVNTPIMFG